MRVFVVIVVAVVVGGGGGLLSVQGAKEIEKRTDQC